MSGKAFFFLFSIQHSVRVSRKKLWKIGFSLPLCFPLEYRTIYWNFTRAKNFMEIFPLRSNKREATSILSSLQLKLEKYCFQLGFSLHFWAFVIHYSFNCFFFSFCAGINNFKKWVTKFYFTFCNPL